MKRKTFTSKTKIQKILLFPEKFNSLLLVLSIMLIGAIVVSITAFALPKPDYTYTPDYSETLYYNHINPYIRVLSNYSITDEELVRKDNIIMCYFGKTTSNKSIKVKGSYIYLTKNNDYIYKGELTETVKATYSSTYYLSSSETIESGLKTIFGKVYFTPVIDNIQGEKQYISFKEDILTLSKSEITQENKNEFTNIEDIISAYTVTCDDKTTYYLITSRIELKSSIEIKYHIDYQMFAVDDESKAYEVVGYYNLSNNYSTIYSHSGQMPISTQITYIISKIRVITEEKGEQIFYYKQPFVVA